MGSRVKRRGVSFVLKSFLHRVEKVREITQLYEVSSVSREEEVTLSKKVQYIL